MGGHWLGPDGRALARRCRGLSHARRMADQHVAAQRRPPARLGGAGPVRMGRDTPLAGRPLQEGAAVLARCHRGRLDACARHQAPKRHELSLGPGRIRRAYGLRAALGVLGAGRRTRSLLSVRPCGGGICIPQPVLPLASIPPGPCALAALWCRRAGLDVRLGAAGQRCALPQPYLLVRVVVLGVVHCSGCASAAPSPVFAAEPDSGCARLKRPAVVPASQRTISTGVFVEASTFCATEPSTAAPKAPRPWLPMTTRWKRPELARRAISRSGVQTLCRKIG